MKTMIAVIFSYIFLTGTALGQIESYISSDSEHYLIGDQIELDFILKINEDYHVDQLDLSSLGSIYSPNGEPDSTGKIIYPLADLNILDFGNWQTNKSEVFGVKEVDWQVQKLNNKKIFQNKVKLSFWEPGRYEIKDISYRVSKNGQSQIFNSGNSMTLIISAPGNLEELSPDSIEIAPIKNILFEPKLFSDYLPYAYTLLSLLLIGLLIYYLTRMKKEKVEEEVPEIIRPAHEIAFEQLEVLEKEELWQNNKIKAYQSRLTHIIREYLENRYEIRALEMTSEEIGDQLRKRDFEMKWKDSLNRILQIADLVKFAKAEPPVEINQQFMDEARAFISNTKRLEYEINQLTEEN